MIEEVSRSWQRDGEWRIAPAGVAWIAKGARVFVGCGAEMHDGAIIGEGASIGEWARIGEGASIGEGDSIGEWARIGEGASIGADVEWAIDLGWADGYRKCLASVSGVAYIGAGCRWFTLAEAIRHWSSMGESRALTMCLMEAAVAIAGYRGLDTGAVLAKGGA